jgi:hypothetical protein
MKTFCVEINKEQPEWKVIQALVQLGFQKALWCDEMKTSFVEVYVALKTFSNYSSKMHKENILTLTEVINRVYEPQFKTNNMIKYYKDGYRMSDIEAIQWKNKRRLAKIHKLKRENRLLSSRRNRLMDKKIDQTATYRQISGFDLYRYSVKLNRISEQIGRNSAKILRLRTLIKQSEV